MAGYQVIRKWFSYREKELLGRPITKDESRRVAEMAHRGAAADRSRTGCELRVGEPADASLAGLRGFIFWLRRREEPETGAAFAVPPRRMRRDLLAFTVEWSLSGLPSRLDLFL